MFSQVKAAPADPILGLTDAFKVDPRGHKVNLGVGVYKDSKGATPILKTVKQAETRLLETEITKSYLSISGIPEYAEVVQELLFGADHSIIADKRAQTAHAPGGTGALRVAADFMVRQLGLKRIWVSDPTWANHQNIFIAAGLEVFNYRYYNAEHNNLDFTGMMKDLEDVNPATDAVLLHGCCHNPTGIDPTADQWQAIADVAAQNKWLALFDFAYQGFAYGVEEDAQGLRNFLKSNNEVLIASSFSKNFGLYNERVGAVTLVGNNAEEADIAFSQIKAIIRAIYSNPPAHGALVVSTILKDADLKAQWLAEVADMRARIHEMRDQMVNKLTALGVNRDFSFIRQQNGMFSFSGLTRDQVAKLKDDFAIYIVGSGRISVAGITPDNIDYLCESMAKVL